MSEFSASRLMLWIDAVGYEVDVYYSPKHDRDKYNFRRWSVTSDGLRVDDNVYGDTLEEALENLAEFALEKGIQPEVRTVYEYSDPKGRATRKPRYE